LRSFPVISMLAPVSCFSNCCSPTFLFVHKLIIQDLGDFPVVFTTGPGAVAEAFSAFTNFKTERYKAVAGVYEGVGNRTVTIVGAKANQNMYITRVIEAVSSNNVKDEVYRKTGMMHLTKMGLREKKWGVSCIQRMYYEEEALNLTFTPTWSAGSP